MDNSHDAEVELSTPVAQEDMADDVPAWELIDTGRFRPRRIRGSYRGRELG